MRVRQSGAGECVSSGCRLLGWSLFGSVLLAAGMLMSSPLPAQNREGQPVPVILDTDIGPDVDDAGTVALLHALADRGEAKILAMVCCTSNPGGAACLDALNTYYGRPDIPVGTLKKPGFLPTSKYAERIAREFPNQLRTGEHAPDAVALYRQVLSRQPDGSAVVCAVGPLVNLAWLLDSRPDAVSPLSGKELVQKKVRLLAVMGGRYPEGKEWNFEQDPAAAAQVVSEWPTPILFSGFEIGERVLTGERLHTETPENNPVRVAYTYYIGANKNRESWDQTALLAAIRGPESHWKVHTSGSNVVDPTTGANRWVATPNRPHSYLIERDAPEQVKKAIDDLMVQPPRRPAQR